jgi:hypothetical protein
MRRKRIGKYSVGDLVAYEHTPFNAPAAREFVGIIVRGARVPGGGVYQIKRVNTEIVDVQIDETEIKGAL